MNKNILFIQADMHRAINDGRRSFEVSVIDMKELIAAVAGIEGREQVQKLGHVFGFIRDDQLKNMREGNALYCSIRRKKNDEYCTPVYCDPLEKPLDQIEEVKQD